MKKLIGATTLALFIFTIGFCEGTVETVNSDDTYEVGPGGCVNFSCGSAYLDSFNSSLNAYILARDLTDQEMEEADDLDGGAYNDGKWTGENPPENEDENGNPTYAAQQVFEDDDGNIFILEDDGEVTEVAT